MRTFILLLFLCSIISWGCKKSSGDSSGNNPPAAPANPQPASGAIGVALPLTFYWTASTDPDGDAVYYDFYLDTLPAASTLVQARLASAFFQYPSLVRGKRYYWKVVASDLKGHETAGPVWTFKLIDAGPGSQAPETPVNPYPLNGASNVSLAVVLSWSKCLDPQSDPVTYDIYLDNSPSPTVLLASDVSDTFYHPGNLSVLTHYYWKVISKDNHGNTSSGSIWNFTSGNFEYGSFTDPRDNRVYRTIEINGLTWMADNLAYNPGVNSAWKYPAGNAAYDAAYGKLYQNVYVYSHNLAPEGWHMATDADWSSLISFAGSDGGQLKEKGTSSWSSPNTAATDAFGFDAKGAGMGDNIRQSADFIMGVPSPSGFIIYHLSYNSRVISNTFTSTGIPDDYYYSIRCVKN